LFAGIFQPRTVLIEICQGLFRRAKAYAILISHKEVIRKAGAGNMGGKLTIIIDGKNAIGPGGEWDQAVDKQRPNAGGSRI
jgi:hypothetical protein